MPYCTAVDIDEEKRKRKSEFYPFAATVGILYSTLQYLVSTPFKKSWAFVSP